MLASSAAMGPSASCAGGSPAKGWSGPPWAVRGARSSVQLGGVSRASSPGPAWGKMGVDAFLSSSCASWSRIGVSRGGRARRGWARRRWRVRGSLRGGVGVGEVAAEEPAPSHGCVGVEEVAEAVHDAVAASSPDGLPGLRVMVLHELLQNVKVREARPLGTRARVVLGTGRSLSLRVRERAEGRDERERGGERQPCAGRGHRRLRRYAVRARKEWLWGVRDSYRYRPSETGPRKVEASK
jgi:hypothetical protein